MNAKIRTIIITLIAAGSFATATIAPAICQAQDNRTAATGLTQEELEKGGASCEQAGEDFIVCTNGGHEWYCNHEGCGQVKSASVGTTVLRVTTGLTLKAAPVVTTPPVVLKVTRTAMTVR
jgi:hypothetical protein